MAEGGLRAKIAPLGRRLLAREAHVTRGTGIGLARSIAERRKPKHLDSATRLAQGRSLARRGAGPVEEKAPMPSYISDFAAAVLFGDGSYAPTESGERTSPLFAETARLKEAKAQRVAAGEPIPRGVVEEVSGLPQGEPAAPNGGGFRLARKPLEEPPSPPPAAEADAPEPAPVEPTPAPVEPAPAPVEPAIARSPAAEASSDPAPVELVQKPARDRGTTLPQGLLARDRDEQRPDASGSQSTPPPPEPAPEAQPEQAPPADASAGQAPRPEPEPQPEQAPAAADAPAPEQPEQAPPSAEASAPAEPAQAPPAAGDGAADAPASSEQSEPAAFTICAAKPSEFVWNSERWPLPHLSQKNSN